MATYSSERRFNMSSSAPPAETRPLALRRRPIPVPWNAELLFYLLAQFVVGIICLVFESVNGEDFLEVTKWTTAAYLISRGIAKAGRVLDEL
jgi:hypothetical protein